MQSPTIISGKIQEFGGLRYYLCGYYYQRGGVRLHRAVWEASKGRIGAGFHVHHIDGDRSNNSIQNLELISGNGHARLHSSDPARIAKFKEVATPKGIEAAKEWHKSDAGLDWHMRHYESGPGKAMHALKVHACVQCGAEYKSFRAGTAKFCSDACMSENRRKSGVDDETRACKHCGSVFSVNKYVKKQFCGRSCAQKHRSTNNEFKPLEPKVENKCTVCNSAFISKTTRAKYCSKECKEVVGKIIKQSTFKRTCEVCGVEYDCNKYKQKRTCSRACASKLIVEARKKSRESSAS